MIFCAGHTLLSDGSVFTAGGHVDADVGIARMYRFSTSNDQFSDQGKMQKKVNNAMVDYPRWYPTCLVLPDRRVMTFAGTDVVNGNPVLQATPTLWMNGFPGGTAYQATSLPDLNSFGYYPFLFVDPTDGNVFFTPNAVPCRKPIPWGRHELGHAWSQPASGFDP